MHVIKERPYMQVAPKHMQKHKEKVIESHRKKRKQHICAVTILIEGMLSVLLYFEAYFEIFQTWNTLFRNTFLVVLQNEALPSERLQEFTL